MWSWFDRMILHLREQFAVMIPTESSVCGCLIDPTSDWPISTPVVYVFEFIMCWARKGVHMSPMPNTMQRRNGHTM